MSTAATLQRARAHAAARATRVAERRAARTSATPTLALDSDEVRFPQANGIKRTYVPPTTTGPVVSTATEWGNSRFTTYEACPREYYWSYVNPHRKVVSQTTAADRGIAFHAGVRAWLQGAASREIRDAVERHSNNDDVARSVAERLVQAYLLRYPDEPKYCLGVEVLLSATLRVREPGADLMRDVPLTTRPDALSGRDGEVRWLEHKTRDRHAPAELNHYLFHPQLMQGDLVWRLTGCPDEVRKAIGRKRIAIREGLPVVMDMVYALKVIQCDRLPPINIAKRTAEAFGLQRAAVYLDLQRRMQESTDRGAHPAVPEGWPQHTSQCRRGQWFCRFFELCAPHGRGMCVYEPAPKPKPEPETET